MAEITITTAEVASIEGDDLVALCRDVSLEINRLQALQAAVSNRIWLASEGYSGQDTLTKRYGCRSSVELIQRVSGEPAHLVSARLKLGRQVAERDSLLGEKLLPMQEHVATGLESGFLNVNSAVHISKVLERNAKAHPEDLEVAERCLVQAATGLDYDTGDAPTMPLHADDIRRLCVKWDEGLDPDGVAPNEEDRRHKRFLNIGPVKDGMASIRGSVTAEVAAALGAIMNTLNNPRANTDGPPRPGTTGLLDGAEQVACSAPLGDCDLLDSVHKQDEAPADSALAGLNADGERSVDSSSQAIGADGHTDEAGDSVGDATGDVAEDLGTDPTDDRSPGQKRHDALAMALDVALADRDLPVLQGASATIVVEVKQESLDNTHAAGWLVDHNGAPTPVPMRSVHALSCNANIQTVVRNSLGKIMGLGSPQRLFTASQRRAISLRDGGCIIPGCNTPAAWCEVHHVTPHSRGGPTHTDNGVLLCRFHHANIDTSGWEIQMLKGIPFVKPPAWISRLHPDDSRRSWMNQVMADQTRQVQEKLARRKRRSGPPKSVA